MLKGAELIFLDCGDPAQILESRNFINGVTTNPTLLLRAGFISRLQIEIGLRELVREIYPLPISIEQDVDERTTAEQMIRAGLYLRSLGKNVVVKIPVEPFPACYEAIAELSEKGVPINATLIFRWEQAVRSAQCGAAYVSPFIGRIDDIPQLYGKGVDLISEIVARFEEYKIDRGKTKILAASIRGVPEMKAAFERGADIATVPREVLKAYCDHEWSYTQRKTSESPFSPANLSHPLTTYGLMKFHKDWLEIPYVTKQDEKDWGL